MVKQKVILWRVEEYDLSQCVRALPYEGKSWWAIKPTHLTRLKKFLKANSDKILPERVTIISLSEINYTEIKALDFKKTNEYVLGKSEEIPQLMNFDFKIHTLEWKDSPMKEFGFSTYEIESCGGCPFHPVSTYQVLIK